MRVLFTPVNMEKIQKKNNSETFPKKISSFTRFKLVFQSCCHFIYCTLCNTVSFNSSCALPTSGLVNIELFSAANHLLFVKLFFSSKSFLPSQSPFRKPCFLELVMKGSLNISLSSTIKSSSPAGMRRLRYKHQDENKSIWVQVFEVLKLKALSYDPNL